MGDFIVIILETFTLFWECIYRIKDAKVFSSWRSLKNCCRWDCLQASFSIELLPPSHSRRAFFLVGGLVVLLKDKRPQHSFIDSWPEYSSCSCLGYLMVSQTYRALVLQVYSVNGFHFYRRMKNVWKSTCFHLPPFLFISPHLASQNISTFQHSIQKFPKYTKVIKGLLWEIGCTNTSL